MSNHSLPAGENGKRRRFVPIVWLASIAAAVLLALGVGGTLSGFTASINNSANTAGTGTLVMEEDSGSVSCFSNTTNSPTNTIPGTTVDAGNAGTCATINKLTGNTALTPGAAATSVTVTIKNIGTTAASTFTLTPAATCAQSANGAINGTATDFCTKLKVTINAGATPGSSLFTGNAASLAAHGAFTLPTVAGNGGSAQFTFSVSLDGTVDNTYQGLKASLPMTWAFSA